MILRYAEDTTTENGVMSPSINDLPPTDYDYQFEQLRHSLSEDHDFRDFFTDIGKKTIFAESIHSLFEPFSHPGPRQR